MPVLQVTKGISSSSVVSIPEKWDANWFRSFIKNQLSLMDVRNANQGSGIAISGTPSQPATISLGSVALASLAPIAGLSIVGNNGAAVATPAALTETQVTAMLNVFSASLQGLVPASGGGTANFLRADGSFAAPPSASPANPSASVGLTVVNGVAATFMRSDAAPALSQAIVPTWTGIHTFSAAPVINAGATISGVVGIGTVAGMGKLAVLTTDANLAGGLSTWNLPQYAIFGPNVGAATGAAIGVGYDTTADQALIQAIAPAVAYKPLVLASSKLQWAASGVTPALDLGYLGAPQNLKTVSYTLVLSDAGKQIRQDTSATTITIPANASVAFPIGTIVVIFNNSAGNISIAITTDTLFIFNTVTTGVRTLGTNGVAAIMKTDATHWGIAGIGLT